jgi:hypothetical protein
MKVAKPIAFALITQLLAAPLTSGMLVLCFGSDGHVEVESAGTSLCCREWEKAHQDAGDEALAASIVPASGPCCNDLELSVESATLTVPTQKVIPASVIPCSVLLTNASLRTAPTDTFPLLTESPVIASLRTVVLRA